jgi:hypothetical protein
LKREPEKAKLPEKGLGRAGKLKIPQRPSPGRFTARSLPAGEGFDNALQFLVAAII